MTFVDLKRTIYTQIEHYRHRGLTADSVRLGQAEMRVVIEEISRFDILASGRSVAPVGTLYFRGLKIVETLEPTGVVVSAAW